MIAGENLCVMSSDMSTLAMRPEVAGLSSYPGFLVKSSLVRHRCQPTAKSLK